MSILLDDQPVVLDDLEFEVPCAMKCGHPADVYVTCRFCDTNAGALCYRHLQAKRAEAAQMLRTKKAIACAQCARVALTFDDLFEVVDL